MGTLSNFGVNLWKTMVCPKTVIFVKCHVFGGHLNEISVVYWEFDVRLSQRAILCAKSVEMTGVRLQILELSGRKVR